MCKLSGVIYYLYYKRSREPICSFVQWEISIFFYFSIYWNPVVSTPCCLRCCHIPSVYAWCLWQKGGNFMFLDSYLGIKFTSINPCSCVLFVCLFLCFYQYQAVFNTMFLVVVWMKTIALVPNKLFRRD